MVKGEERDGAHKSSFPSNLFWAINCLEVDKVRPAEAVSAGADDMMTRALNRWDVK